MYLWTLLGIDCRTVAGHAGGRHAWNVIVNEKGEEISLDATFAATSGVRDARIFMFSDKEDQQNEHDQEGEQGQSSHLIQLDQPLHLDQLNGSDQQRRQRVPGQLDQPKDEPEK